MAESAAYLIGTGLGMDLDDASTFYVTSWGADSKRMSALASQVLQIAQRIDETLADLPRASA